MKIILSIIISALLFGGGVYYWQNIIVKDLEQKNVLINDKVNQLSENYNTLKKELVTTREELAQMNERKKDTSLAFDIIKETYFVSKPTNSDLVSFAVLFDDKQMCDDVSGADKELCINIFDNNCGVYENPNLEICEDFRTILNRDITSNDLIEHCNSKEEITDDMAQAHCFQRFARATKNINLCYEICKSPIDNTNCRASCMDKDENLVSCKEQYIEDCVNNATNNIE